MLYIIQDRAHLLIRVTLLRYFYRILYNFPRFNDTRKYCARHTGAFEGIPWFCRVFLIGQERSDERRGMVP